MIINKIYLQSLYIFFMGVFTSFSLPPYNFWIISFFTFSLLFVLLVKNHDKNSRVFFFYGYFFGFGYFLFSLYWIPFSLSYDENFKSFIPIATIIIPALLSLFYALAFLGFKLLLNSKSIFANLLTFSLLLGLSEFIRGIILSGFPWNLFAYSFSENISFIQIISLIGTYAFNTILITFFTIPSIFLLNKKKSDLKGFYLILTIIISTFIYGSIKLKNFSNLKADNLFTEIKILSTNIPIERFYSKLDDEEILIKLIELSDPKKENDTIFIWPESVIPNIDLNMLKYEYDYLLKKSFSKNHKIILGINDTKIKNDKQKYYNSLTVINYEGEVIYKYYKNKLVPFGEFLPLESILSKIGLKSLTNNYQSYSAGSERKIFEFSNDSRIKILPLICYEIIYSGNLAKNKNNDYNFIVNISEDGWFGNTIGPYQHFAHTIFRSIEHGKYTFRSANNGISAIVDPSGSIVDQLNIENEGVISIKETVILDETVFSTFGEKIYFFIILLYIFLIFSFRKFNNE